MPELEALQTQIQRARWRVRSATIGSPEWDAALSGLEDLERTLRRARRLAQPRADHGSAAAQLA
jgi:hypothetical protein